MTEKGRRDFCIECRKETEYLLQKKDVVKNIRDKEYTFAITVAVCAECGEESAVFMISEYSLEGTCPSRYLGIVTSPNPSARDSGAFPIL